jgi:hypothetical protein
MIALILLVIILIFTVFTDRYSDEDAGGREVQLNDKKSM